MAFRKTVALLPLAILGASCASAERAPTGDAQAYRRLYVSTPSHTDGYAMSGASEGSSPAGGTAHPSSVEAVERAVTALRGELIEEGFEVVAEDREADAVLELTIGGIGDHGEAERAFVAVRDGGSGRLVAVFTAHDRLQGRGAPTVERLLAPLVDAMGEMVRSFQDSDSD